MTANARGRGAVARALDIVASIAVLLAVAEAMILVAQRGWDAGPGRPLTVVALAGGCMGAVVALIALRGRFGDGLRIAARLLVLTGMLVALKLVVDRWPSPRRRGAVEVYVSSDSSVQALPVEQRLPWAARVAAHAISTGGRDGSTLRIPRAWPFPPSTTIRLREAADSMTVIAVDTASGTGCHFTLFTRIPDRSALAMRGMPVHCDGSPSPTPAPTLTIVRTEGLAAAPVALSAPSAARPAAPRAMPASAWTQYRRDAARSGVAGAGAPPPSRWQLQLDGEVRATASLVGDRLFIGTHGPGAFHVVAADSGRLEWMRYLPNWVHQDAVSDGRTVVIGFGDNTHSLSGDAPSGVSAFDVASGALKWTAFEGNSVMTSAVLWRDRAVSATSAGMMTIRDLETGAESGRLELRGRVTMAPPILVGDTLIATLDTARVCAINLATVTTNWCTDLPGNGMLGHSAAAAIDGRVILSAPPFNPRRGNSEWHSTWRRFKQSVGWYFGRDEYLGQRIYALDLGTGQVLWESKTYPTQFGPAGHSSGTPIAEDGIGVVVLPLSGMTVGFDLATGAERWTQPTGPIRGPPAHVDGRLFLTLRSGEIRVVRAATGVIECSIATTTSFDRIGPAIAGGTLFFASTRGALFAVPIDLLTRCAADEVLALVR